MRNPMRATMDQFRLLLNDWDPVGLIGLGAPEDEYECLVGPVLARLAAGQDVDQIANFLRQQLDGHFGANDVAADCGHFAHTATAWWRGRVGE
jgi:hypothetical protein